MTTLTPALRLNILSRIIEFGACPITPPLFGWLLEAQIITQNGFDKARAAEEHAKIEAEYRKELYPNG